MMIFLLPVHQQDKAWFQIYIPDEILLKLPPVKITSWLHKYIRRYLNQENDADKIESVLFRPIADCLKNRRLDDNNFRWQ